jgi:hypothetical protein
MILFIPLLRGREERKPELKEQDTGQGERSCLPGLGPGTCDQIQESTSLGNPPPAGKVNGTDGFRAGLVWMGGGLDTRSVSERAARLGTDEPTGAEADKAASAM